jgi:hypothetical protein
MTAEELFELEQQNSPVDGSEDWNRCDSYVTGSL